MIIAVDIGTTKVKAYAFSIAGEVLAWTERNNQTLVPYADWSEQAPEAVFRNVVDGLKDLLLTTFKKYPSAEIKGIVLSSAMHGMMAIDKKGEPLTNFMLWSDTRAAEAALELRHQDLGYVLYSKTGVPIHPMSPLVKLIWLRQNLPEVFRHAHKFLGIKEYVWFRLTGNFESDLSCASATGLMNIHENTWDETALKLVGISAEQLPELVSPTYISSTTQWAGLESVPLIIGASDGALANLGCDATGPGKVAVTIGTSAAIRLMTHIPILDEQMRTFCYRLDETRFIVGGASNNGTNALEWLRSSVFRSSLSPDDFANQASGVPSGANGLRFFPYLLGERAPLWDASARASFVGLTMQHTQAHFIRAVMEGVLLNLKSIAEVLEEKAPIHQVSISGGFSQNKLWVSMLEEIFQKEILMDHHGTDASVRGAFLMGKTALGLE